MISRALLALLLAPGTVLTLQATATDPDGDPLTWHWHLTPESGPRDAVFAAPTQDYTRRLLSAACLD